MDGFQLTAALFESVTNLIGSFAWPAAFVVVVYMFRKKLVELLPLLNLKYKDAEANFRLDQAEKDAAALPPPEYTPDQQPTPEEKSRFEQVAELSPRAAILEARFDIDDALRSLAVGANVTDGKSTQSTLTLTRVLRNSGVIEQNTSALLDDLRVIGNNAAHNSEVEYSVEDAIRYRKLADRVINQIRVRESIVRDDD